MTFCSLNRNFVAFETNKQYNIMEQILESTIPPFNFPTVEDKSKKIIKVIGVGGGGGNAVQHMWEEGVKDVTFIVCNTDSQVLSANKVPNKFVLGDGLGAGGNPIRGKEKAEQYLDDIKSLFDVDTKMVFIMAGMGGGTGTGAAPVIAKTAKDMGILTVGVVTLPFALEGKKRIDKALIGVEEMRKNVDSLLVINNEKLIDQYGGSDMTLEEGMAKADEVLSIATKTVSEIITVMGMVNRDFEDINTVMRNGGTALVSVAKASGEQRIFKAMSEALNSPLLNNIDKQKAKKLLYIVYSGDVNPTRMSELTEINQFMEGFNDDIEVLWGHYPDKQLGDETKVSIIATGFDRDEIVEDINTCADKTEALNRLREYYYPSHKPTAITAKSSEKEETEVAETQQPKVPAAQNNAPKTFIQKLKERLISIIDED